MPLKENPDCLGKSRHIALKKLNSLWNRFVKDPELLTLYSNFMHEYLELGHMYEIKEIEEKSESYYIPHLGVFRPESKTSPLRVVFNASTLTIAGNSLNSIQYNGGVIEDDLFAIMVRFRKHAFAFTADIKKMYRMILVHPSQKQLQRILWKDSYNGPIKTYELATVTYGTASAPFLAMRTLKQLAIDERKRYPAAAAVLESDLYMDDVLSGSDDLETAKTLQRELIYILSSEKMSLHKRCSNAAELAVNGESYPFSNPEETKTLGVVWKSKTDCFCFKVASEEFGVTKRLVLSTIARVFDPLGILGADEWLQFSSALQNVNDIEVDRCILLPKPDLIEIHGFADASEAAYGAAVYCKSRSRSGEVFIKLIASKSRVSPIKRLTIPKLELCSAVLLAKLVTRVISALKLDITNTFLWSDSVIVLCWLQKELCYLKTFVANRVSEIQKLTNVDQWRHVSSQDNPADLISRSVDPDRLSESSLWWSGPEFLTHDSYPKRDIPSTVIQNDFSNELKNSNYSDSKCFSVFSDGVNNFANGLIDLKLVTELTSEAFVATLKRFFSRRRKCSKLFSDNATNFAGSNQELRKLHGMVKNPDGVLSGYLSSEGIDWKFLPPRAPNFGGLWEAGVKSFKHHLKRLVGNSKLTFEEFLTVTTQIEGILNSRPLVPLTADMEDLNALTPAHFLIGRQINSIVEPNLFEIPECRLKIWQKLTKMIQIIWKRWSNDYLCNLQQRGKWFFDKNIVRIGDLVIIKEDNMAVCHWEE
ncbi:hypothetical protein AVEN_219110-1 [Araneus ventricosus]|uniref:Integrase catalytic domain-containing protein n=1 Tax=Araneus ventricosus TaxID=182803 RepID=A0A4Y2RQQ2_ARAVE|nr:hypothetical protein AVEN_269169-1 [Araneus ventricosus]GBN75307.1 hypothetical protein AVEN_187372-1 [Araneus ventricosus]GBN78028.1 hypothetical protein AVEN_265555-1 [Araneus ventricosus]GBN78051.1 hypothetical protein AVEN_219110-1 [Araneus ventricosus]